MNQIEKVALTLGAVGLGAWWLARRSGRYAFRNKVVLVTGGSRGLGLVLARQLADEGARVAICARDVQELRAASQGLAQRPGEHLALRCDVTDPAHVRELVRTIEAHLGPIDVLVNNAGIIEVGPLETMTREDFEKAFATNFWAAFNTIEAVLPGMRARKAGRIVNVSSIGGKIAVPHLVPYSASKFALVGYSHGLRAELARDGIVVTTVCPGLMRTGSPGHALFKGQHRAEHAWFSIGDSLPLLTLRAERAARQALDACRRGDAEAVLGLPAQVAVKLHALFPNLSENVLALVNRLLPGPGGVGKETRTGQESESRASPSVLTTLSDRAAEQNKELEPARR